MTVQRGEIYFVNLNPVQGREQAGQRPVLVLDRYDQSAATGRDGDSWHKGSQSAAGLSDERAGGSG